MARKDEDDLHTVKSEKTRTRPAQLNCAVLNPMSDGVLMKSD